MLNIQNSQKLKKLTAGVNKFSNNLYVKVISQGMMGIMAITLAGSFLMIINSVISMFGLNEALSGVVTICTIGQNICLNFVTVFVIISLSGVMAREMKVDVTASVMLSLACFFILTPIGRLYPSLEEGTKAISAVNISYLGSKGMFVGMIVSVVVTRVYAMLVKKNMTIKMPSSVPPFVTKNFAQIVPYAITVLGTMVVYGIFSMTPSGNIHDVIYKYLQMPLQNLGSTVWAACILVLVAELLWFFGIHGSAVTSSLLTALFATQAYANVELVTQGLAAEHIVNSFFIECFKGPRSIALAALLIWFCRSQHMKGVGKVAIIPSIFAITEPMKFGIPMVFNPWLLIPMSLSAPISILIAYIATEIGFMGIVTVNVGRSFPHFLNGFMACGWKGLVVQIIQFVVICLMYIPFLRKLDNDALAREQAAGK
ncbi:MAG: PTS sugar transporter subunit IIC [Lachnospiraceae bacterium]